MSARPQPIPDQQPWLNEARLHHWRIAAGVTVAAVLCCWFLGARNGLDLNSKPIGTDFVSFWTAARAALMVDPATAYNPVAHAALQIESFGPGAGYFAFFYPPPFLLLCLPLGLLGYGAALAAWLGLTGAAYVAVAARALQWPPGRAAMLALAFPAVLINIGHGQNGFLFAALMGGGLLLLDRRPILAGCILGALVMKPHLALLLPLAFALRGAWRVLIAMGLSACAICLVSLWLLGPDAWRGFLDGAPLARVTLETGLVSPAKMVSLFAAGRVVGLSVPASYLIHAIGAAIAGVLIWRAARKRMPAADQNALLVAGTLAISPFLLDYDLTLLAWPLAWMAVRGRSTGFVAHERLAMLAIFVAPLILRPLASATALPFAPAMTFGLLALCWRRATLTALPYRHSHAASVR
ncbi:glycosyltransferase family 87 protein [Sphingomonas sp.]|uniref:glycosyltransferase family 87 protein n=1 Tax=Sphingomonas sp. TaxID=28214 RepID=UPI002CF2DB71|nr:glycosyltransferase family 87 protein [Sphingomonas sp.]HTG38349.1 glycosyltransferase family 87 protein [Sphingomonas sp.]